MRPTNVGTAKLNCPVCLSPIERHADWCAGEIRTESEFLAAPIGTVMRDRNRDLFVKATERGARQDGVEGLWGPTWVAYPAEILA